MSRAQDRSITDNGACRPTLRDRAERPGGATGHRGEATKAGRRSGLIAAEGAAPRLAVRGLAVGGRAVRTAGAGPDPLLHTGPDTSARHPPVGFPSTRGVATDMTGPTPSPRGAGCRVVHVRVCVSQQLGSGVSVPPVVSAGVVVQVGRCLCTSFPTFPAGRTCSAPRLLSKGPPAMDVVVAKPLRASRHRRAGYRCRAAGS
jgi:hypothetical protein